MWLGSCQFSSNLQLIPQCIIPVFEGLFLQEHKHHEKAILDTLFLLATWHSYAKLCLYTEDFASIQKTHSDHSKT